MPKVVDIRKKNLGLDKRTKETLEKQLVTVIVDELGKLRDQLAQENRQNRVEKRTKELIAQRKRELVVERRKLAKNLIPAFTRRLETSETFRDEIAEEISGQGVNPYPLSRLLSEPGRAQRDAVEQLAMQTAVEITKPKANAQAVVEKNLRFTALEKIAQTVGK